MFTFPMRLTFFLIFLFARVLVILLVIVLFSFFGS
jgi:hypothetical protein